jgi:hypothetical protein
MASMQLLWLSSWSLWLRELFRWQIAHSVCNLAERVVLRGPRSFAMACALMPVRRNHYWLRISALPVSGCTPADLSALELQGHPCLLAS